MIGTTVASGSEVAESFLDAFSRVGVTLPEAAVVAVRGRSKREAVADLVGTYMAPGPDRDQMADRIYADFRATLLARYEHAARPVPGARVTLEALERGGVSVVLTTGLDRETAERIVRGLGWGSLDFGGLVTGDDVPRGRPAPDLIHAAMALVGEQDAGAVLVVGDTTSDLEAAEQAGVGWSVGVLGGAHTRGQLESRAHTVILDSVADLPDWLVREGLLESERDTAH